MKDERLYAKFSLDIRHSAKWIVLSAEAKVCFFEAVLWSREQLTDGFLPRRLAVCQWSATALLELCQNDPLKPSLVEVESGYQIHDFDKHQDTKAEVHARRERARVAGQLGGLAKAKRPAKRPAKQQPLSQLVSQTLSQNVPETETHIALDPNGSSAADTPPATRGGGRIRDDAPANFYDDLERDNCPFCDEYGYRPTGVVCDHIDRTETYKNGSAAAREALNKTKTQNYGFWG